MLIQMESQEQVAGRKQKKKTKRRQPDGPKVPTPNGAARQAKDDLYRLERECLEQLTADPSSFADVERMVHERMRYHADVFMAAMLSKAGSSDQMNEHVGKTMGQAEGEFRAIEKKGDR